LAQKLTEASKNKRKQTPKKETPVPEAA